MINLNQPHEEGKLKPFNEDFNKIEQVPLDKSDSFDGKRKMDKGVDHGKVIKRPNING